MTWNVKLFKKHWISDKLPVTVWQRFSYAPVVEIKVKHGARKGGTLNRKYMQVQVQRKKIMLNSRASETQRQKLGPWSARHDNLHIYTRDEDSPKTSFSCPGHPDTPVWQIKMGTIVMIRCYSKKPIREESLFWKFVKENPNKFPVKHFPLEFNDTCFFKSNVTKIWINFCIIWYYM